MPKDFEPMPWSPEFLSELQNMPRQLQQTVALIPSDRIDWKPESWGGCPSENFSVPEHVCLLRDIDRDGYQVRIRRMLNEVEPCLASLDSYKIARERRYEATDLQVTLKEFRHARSTTFEQVRGLSDVQLARAGEFAQYGRLSLRAVVHYLRCHDQQHLAGIHWLAGRIASAG